MYCQIFKEIILEAIANDLIRGVYVNTYEPRVYLGDSTIHGKGVFASRDIKNGESLTMYPPHYVLSFPDGRDKNVRIIILCSDLTDHIPITDEMRLKYSYRISEYMNICGNPNLTNNNLLLGHMINDGAKAHSTKTNMNESDYNLYNIVSAINSNCIFKSSIVQLLDGEQIEIIDIVASKDIKKDEELFVTYGYEYWVDVNTKSS